MAHPLFQVDAFASQPFEGNPAAVCLLEHPVSDDWMQSMADEMNKPATAFLLPAGKRWTLRWFTPRTELTLCGHATLAAAHILWEQRIAADDRIELETAAGVLAARREGDRIALEFPPRPLSAAETSEAIQDVLGRVPIVWAGRNGMDFVAVLADEATVRGARPDLGRLASIDVRGLAITARSDNARYDFVSRFFAPSIGVDEDFVTGSVHCALGPYWSVALRKSELRAYQASRRGGEIGMRVAADRITLLGSAITVLSGRLG